MFLIPNPGSTYWCRDSEILNTSNGFVFCPSHDEILLRIAVGDILPVQNLPVPGTCNCWRKTLFDCRIMHFYMTGISPIDTIWFVITNFHKTAQNFVVKNFKTYILVSLMAKN